MSIRVLLVDDQKLVRMGLAMLLDGEDDIEVVGEAADGGEAVRAARRTSPDIVLMDVRMPGMDGLAATRELTAGFCDADDGRVVRVIILTTYHVDEAVYAALRAGASGFVLKDAAPDEIVSAVRAVAEGEAWLDPAVTRRLIGDIAAETPAVPPPLTLDQLTAREREVLRLVALGLSTTEISRHLFIGTATVKTHVSRLLIKLGMRDRAQAVSFAFRHGLVKPGETPPEPRP